MIMILAMLRNLLIIVGALAFLFLPAAAHENGARPQTRQVAGNAKQTYILHGETDQPPEEGFGLLIVLPGGDGSAEFAPFVGNIGRMAPEGYLTAQLIAVPGDANGATWPIEGRPKEQKQDFTTEQFIAAVIDEVAGDVKLNRDKLVVLGWSSGGPPAYAALLDEDLGIDGAFIAMSVFYPGWHQPVARGEDKTLFLLHSPQDQVCRLPLAKNAERMLTRAGATVKFETYEGGHGWQGTAIGSIEPGLAWIDEQLEARQVASPSTRPADGAGE